MSKYHNIFTIDVASCTDAEIYKMSENEPLGMTKHLALCTLVSMNRADTEAPKSCMDAATRDYNPAVTLPSGIAISAGDDLNHLDPSSSNNHDSCASSHSSNYTRGYPVYDSYNTPSNGAVKYDDTAGSDYNEMGQSTNKSDDRYG